MINDKKVQKNEKKLNGISARKPIISGLVSIILTLIASAALLVTVIFVVLIVLKTDEKLFRTFNTESSVMIIIIALGLFASATAILSYFGFSESAVAAKSRIGTVRFPRLCSVDAENKNRDAEQTDKTVTLDEMCRDFRDFASSKYGLYYDISTVRTFIASLCVSKLIIIQGISGTGKTSIAWAFGEYLGNGTNVISVQPSWKEKNDLIGYFNEFTGKYNETVFLEALYRGLYTDKVTVTLLDEMNIARVEYYFAEFLSMLEINDSSKKQIEVISDSSPFDPLLIKNGRMKIPENLWFIGTANRDDSTYTISDKVYDRAMVIQLDRRNEPFPAEEKNPIMLSEKAFDALKEEALCLYPVSSSMNEKIIKLDAYLTDKIGITFGNRIMEQYKVFVPCYVACGGTEEEAADIFIATKILRKLESRSAMLIKKEYTCLTSQFDSLFGAGSMPVCRKYLSRFEK